MMEDLIKAYEDRGVKFWVENGQLKFKAPSGTLNAEDKVKLRNVKEKLIEYYERKDKSALKADLSKRYEPFPLTGIQSAYLLGRNHNYEYGGVGCHAYFELSMPHMDAERLESAWHKVIMRHDMLRAVFLQNGTQKILEHVDLPKLTYFNMKEAGAETTDSKLNEIRAELAHKQYQADCWPLFDLYLTDTIDKSILHFSIDMLLSDFISMKTILNDLDAFYYEDGKNLKPLQVSFRDVLVYQKEHENDEEVRTKKDRDCEYWKKRLQNFPDAPELPILPESKCEKVTFTQYRHFITPENWSKLCEKARMQRLTPSGVVLSAYAEIIGRWSKRKDFCIDITILNRPSIHSQINEIVGDFTEVDILEISPEYPSNFVERTRKIQNQLWEDLSHSAFTGIDVLREINRQSEKKAIIPVVYTSTVGAADSEQQENWEFMRNSRITYKISQTPQVWIDCQVSEDNGGVLINWDVRDGVFPEGFVNDAFEAFSLLIERLCTNLKVWEQVHPVELPLKTGKVRKSVNKTEKDLPDKMLHEGFYNCLQNCPDEIALIAAEGSKKDFDMACVVIRSTAVGGKGTEIAGALLEKGIHVIQEHPVHYNDIVKLLKVAKENNCVYQVNSFYPNVKNVQEFIVKSNKLLKKSRPTYIDATCSTQVLFPMISILGKALSGFHTWKLQTIDSVNSKFPFKVLSGEIRGIPAIVKIQNQLDPKDPDNNGFLLHRIVLGTTEGSLCLDNSNGLVIWNPQMYVPHAEGVLDMYGNNSYVELPVSEVADGVRNTTYAEVYKELWPEGIVCALNDFARAITDNSQKNIMAQQMLTISEIWKDLSEKIGSPQLIVTPERNGIRLADIAE